VLGGGDGDDVLVGSDDDEVDKLDGGTGSTTASSARATKSTTANTERPVSCAPDRGKNARVVAVRSHRRAVTRHAGGQPVTSVLVRIGHLRQWCPTPSPSAGRCSRQGPTSRERPGDRERAGHRLVQGLRNRDDAGHADRGCGECFSRDVTLLTGEEFAVVSLELADA